MTEMKLIIYFPTRPSICSCPSSVKRTTSWPFIQAKCICLPQILLSILFPASVGHQILFQNISSLFPPLHSHYHFFFQVFFSAQNITGFEQVSLALASFLQPIFKCCQSKLPKMKIICHLPHYSRTKRQCISLDFCRKLRFHFLCLKCPSSMATVCWYVQQQ